MCKRDESYHTHKPKIEKTYSSHDNPQPYVQYGDTQVLIRTLGPFRKNAMVRALNEAKYRHDEGTRKHLKKLARRERRQERASRYEAEQRQRLDAAIEKQGLVEPEKKKVAGGVDSLVYALTLIDDIAKAEKARKQQAIVNSYGVPVMNGVGLPPPVEKARFLDGFSDVPDAP